MTAGSILQAPCIRLSGEGKNLIVPVIVQAANPAASAVGAAGIVNETNPRASRERTGRRAFRPRGFRNLRRVMATVFLRPFGVVVQRSATPNGTRLDSGGGGSGGADDSGENRCRDGVGV